MQRGVTRQAEDRQTEAAHEVANEDVKDGGNDGTLGWIDSATVKSLVVELLCVCHGYLVRSTIVKPNSEFGVINGSSEVAWGELKRPLVKPFGEAFRRSLSVKPFGEAPCLRNLVGTGAPLPNPVTS